MANPQDIQQALERMVHHYRSRSWYRGAGIVRSSNGMFILRLNVDPRVNSGNSDVPREFEHIPVEIVHLLGYRGS